MSKRGARASLMAYVSAEEHLLDCYSPLAAGGDMEVMAGPSARPDTRAGGVVSEELFENCSPAPSPQEAPKHGSELDPAVDSMLHVISDDSDIHSLISSEFKGWEEQHPSTSYVCDGEPLIYGLGRSRLTKAETEAEAAPLWSYCTPAKDPCSSQDVIEINDSPDSVPDPTISLIHSGVLLTNGNAGEQFTVEEDEYGDGLQPTEEGVDPCMIYETVDGENMVVLAEEHCCEIIVATQGVASEQEFARAILMGGNGSTGALLGLLPAERHADELNGDNYIEAEMVVEDLADDEVRVPAGNNVYLSDAALEQPLVHQDLVEEEENENATFVDDTPMEEERPDICQVFDDELEDHDRDEENEVCIMQHTTADEPAEAEQEKEETPLQLMSKKLPREHSSPTEFPVSSSSMPNASYNYDYEDDPIVTHTPLKRKYPPLMKNTLYAEAMDRRLASICQAQPQMSPAEKVSSWETAFSNECAAVEDVESFQADFERHEATAAPLKQHSFVEFRETLVRNLEKITRDIMQVSDKSTQEQASSQSAERPVHRRLLHVMPTEETIVLDDDDEDDCYEVMDMDKASVDTLIPEDELMQADQAPEGEEVVLPTDACEQRLVTKETSTTDLNSSAAAPTAAALSAPQLERIVSPNSCFVPVPAPENSSELVDSAPRDIVAPTSSDRQLSSVVLDVMRQQVQMQQQFMDHKLQQQQQQSHQHMYRYQELPEAPPGKHSVEMPLEMAGDQEPRCINNCPTMFYEQQEFCNYLGLTELATANAVATAMRELANSTVARRSLRVRPQQQLDRMRSDVRGKRRDRERQQDKDKKQAPVSSSSSSEPSHSDKEDNALPEGARSVPGGDAELNFVCPLPAINAEEEQLQKEYYYQVQGDYSDVREPMPEKERCKSFKQQESRRSPYQRERRSPGKQESIRRRSSRESEEHMEQEASRGKQAEGQNRAVSVEDAFAKIYDAAAPAQSKLLQSMQQRLRQARETKPSIFIIKATNNEPAQVTQSPKQSSADQLIDAPFKNSAPRSSPVISKAKASPLKATPTKMALPPTPAPTQTQIPKAPKVKKAETATQRRRTTVAATTVPAKPVRIRDLVTRSTTHLNSKLLRNRKVNLLKSYALSDEMAQGRGKRLSGGISTTTPTQGTKKRHTSKVVRGTGSKRPKELGDKKLPEQYRLQEQQLAPPNTPRQSVRGVKPMPTAKTSARKPPPLRVTKHAKRSRAKSLPAAFEGVSDHATAPHYIPSALLGTDVQDKSDSSVTHLQTHSSSTILAPYAKSFLNYPPSPTTPPSNPKVTEPSRHPCQQAGSGDRLAGLDVPNIDSTPPGGVLRLSEGSQALSNPLSQKYGRVLYMYYELEQLIVLQETCITFWKYSKVLSVLHQPKRTTSPVRKSPAPQYSPQHQQEQELDVRPRWVYLGRLRRITSDTEIFTPYGSRICVHNSTPVYLEMKSRPLDHHKREVKLTSLHVNVYYFCEEDLRPRMHSVHLDTVNCEGSHVIYTSIAESRYFVMAWQQELVMGRPRSGICKYSLTPTLDTLASIREFKQLRHELRHIECLSEDRLIGYGQTRVTVWDHRSGDTLMNYDLGRPLGRSLAAMHYPSLDLDQSSMLILFQYLKEPDDSPAEVHVIACELSHATPSHRLLQVHRLPSTQFDDAIEAVNTGDHLIIKSAADGEAWINAADPRQLTYVAPLANGAQRFYSRHKSQVIEMSPQSLTVDSITNHMLKLAVQQQCQYQVPV
ncbi:hypothetical protein KR054_003807 [Drosophila jambulina]|nr:hypothetical protein KR054_003807 [Drosophila jambulina]